MNRFALLILLGCAPLLADGPVYHHKDASQQLEFEDTYQAIRSLTTPLIDYSSYSTITGWSSFTTKIVRYKRIGQTVFVYFDLRGTSNSSAASFTLPFLTSSVLGTIGVATGCLDNGTGGADMCQASVMPGDSTVTLYKDNSGAGWTNSGTKIVYGEMHYEKK